MIKTEEQTNKNSCLNKAKAREPIFVLRGQDKLAPVLIKMWVELAALHGCPVEKLAAAERTLNSINLWALSHKTKFPD